MVLFCAEAGLTCHPGLDPGSIPESGFFLCESGFRIKSAVTTQSSPMNTGESSYQNHTELKQQ